MKIGWISAGGVLSGGSRMSVFNNHFHFLKIGINSKIIYSPKNYCLNLNLPDTYIDLIVEEDFDIVFIQKVCGGNIEKLINILQENGVIVVFGIGDLFGHNMVEKCNFTIAASNYLKEMYPIKLHNKIEVIMDGYEVDPLMRKEHINLDKLNAIYYGTQDLNKDFENFIKKIKWVNLIKLGNPPWANILWDIKNVYHNILKNDVCILYSEMNDFNKSKSINRPLNCMVMGIPVISSPIPSYKKIIHNNDNGIIAENNKFDEFYDALLKLKDINTRKIIGNNARESVLNIRSKEVQSEKYLKFFKKVLKNK